MTTATELAALLATAREAGYTVDAVELEGGVKLRFLPPDGRAVLPPLVPRRPEESEDQFAARERDAKRAKDREVYIKKYAKELGSRARAAAYVDKCLAAPGGVVP